MKILVKYPSRGRPKLLINALTKAIARAENLEDIYFFLTLDNNDPTTKSEAFNNVIASLQGNIIINRGDSIGKIDACNRSMEEAPKDWDIVLLMSDDMICIQKSWDEIIRKQMKANYSDLDGVLFFNDGFCQDRLNTMCILGKKYYSRFGYIYHPAYKSLFSDNEFMEVASSLGKQTYFPQVLFRHEHPANNGRQDLVDHIYQQNDRFYLEDKATYHKRKVRGFR